MYGDLDLLQTAGAMARHAARRHELIAQNVANADTPGYRAQTLADFDPAGAADGSHAMLRPIDREGLITSPNGNGVDVEIEMAAAVDAQAQHEAATTIYRKSIELLRLSVTARG